MNKPSHTRRILVVTLFSIVLTGLFTLLNLGQRFAKEILDELVQRQTKGFYSLLFEDLDISLIDKEIRVKELYLKADSARVHNETNLNTLYEIGLSELIINLQSLYKFYFQKQLEINSMQIHDPKIRMQRIRDRQTGSFSLETGNIYKAISDYLTVLKIDYFRIQDGDLHYNTDQFSLGNIDFQVQNLLLDSVARSNVFYSETISLEIENQKFYLPDSIHEIGFDKFVLSTKDSLLSFENLSIRPTPLSGVQFEGNNEVNVYDISIPKLTLKGVDYQAAYLKDHLIIDELSFSNPVIFVDDETHSVQKKKTEDNSILKLLFTVFHKIDISKLSISDSEIDLKINHDLNFQRIKSEETSIAFYDVSLDTSNYRFNSKYNYFDQFEIQVSNYDYLLPDSIHEVKIGKLHISSKDSTFLMDDISIGGINNNPSKVTLQIPSMNASGFVYSDMLNNKLNISKFHIERVDLTLQNLEKTKKKGKPTLQLIRQAINPTFKSIEIGDFTIKTLYANMNNEVLIDDGTIQLHGLTLNDKTRSLEDLFARSNIELKDIQINKDSMQFFVKKLDLNHDLTQLAMKDGMIDLNTKTIDLNTTFDSIKIFEIQPDSLLTGNYMAFKLAHIAKPSIKLKGSSSDSSKGFDLGIEKEIILTDGSIELDFDSIQATVTNVNSDFYLGDSIAIHGIDARKIHVKSHKANHELKLHRWVYDTLKDEMSFEEFSIAPINKYDSTHPFIHFNSSWIALDGFLQDKFVHQRELILDTLKILNPSLKATIMNRPSKSDSGNFSIQINHINLEGGNLQLNQVSPEISTVIIEDINTKAFGLDYPLSSSLFYSDSIRIEGKSIVPTFSSNQQLSVGEFSFVSSDLADIEINATHFMSADSTKELNIPKLDVYDLELKQMLENGTIQAYEVGLTSPTISITRNLSTEKPNISNPNLDIDLNYFSLRDISIRYADPLTQKNYCVDEVDVDIYRLVNNGEMELDQLIQNIGDISISGPNLSIPIDEFYTIRNGNFSYDMGKESLLIHDAALQPQLSKTEYSRFLENQKDWFSLNVKLIAIDGIDLKEIIRDSTLHFAELDLRHTDFYVYRDKRIPFPENQIGILPHQQVRAIPFPIQIDTIFIDGNVTYEEHPVDNEESGFISFDNINAYIHNLTNENLETNGTMDFVASGQIVEEGKFNVTSTFDLSHPDYFFNFIGKVEDLPLDSLNQMLGPVANVNIKSGMAEEINFQFNANDSLAIGQMTFLYKDLKLQVLNAKKHEANLGSGLMSFFANTFVIRNKNPRFFFPRKGTIYQYRDTSKAIFNYWGKSILSGAVSSVGIHKSDRAEKKDTRSAKKLE